MDKLYIVIPAYNEQDNIEHGPAAAFVEALEAELLAEPETGAAVCAVVACTSQWNGSNCVARRSISRASSCGFSR